MEKIRINLENVGCIEEASISLNKNCVNIKYGNNGIGKTTIIKALKAKIGDDPTTETIIRPLSNQDIEPKIEISEALEEIVVFDREYFDNLFTNDDVLSDTYNYAVKNPEYDDLKGKANALIGEILAIVRGPEFKDFINFMNNSLKAEDEKQNIITYKSDNRTVLKNKTIFSSFSTDGICLKSLPDNSEIKEYEKYLQSGYLCQWLSWLEKYEFDWTQKNDQNEEICPFCGTVFTKKEEGLRQKYELIKKYVGGSKKVQKHNEEQKIIVTLSQYCDTENGKKILGINQLQEVANNENMKLIIEVRNQFITEYEKIQKIYRWNAYELSKKFKDLKDAQQGQMNAFIEEIKSLKLNEDMLKINNSNNENLVIRLNSKIEELVNNIKELVGKLIRFHSKLLKIIEENTSLINDFMKMAGIPYKTEINTSNDEEFTTVLKYNDNKSVNQNRLSYLSYGEANALALILFAIQAQKNNSLIVLDDPVSSFDNNKRYAIYSYLFNIKGKLLYGKTVLIMTHDFLTITAFAKTNLYRDSMCFAYLYSCGNTLKEIPFLRDDLESSLIWYKNFYENVNNDLLSRIVALREYTEITEGKNALLYNYLSGLIHFEESPRYCKKGKEFNTSDIEVCDLSMKKYFKNEDFTYKSAVRELKDEDKLIEWYHKESTSKFSKMCIVRFLYEITKKESTSYEGNKIHNIINNFLCEAYHVETQFMYAIKQAQGDDVPNYIINLCDEFINSLEKREKN